MAFSVRRNGPRNQIDEGSVQSCFLKCVKHELEEKVELVVTFGHSYVALLALPVGEQRMNQGFEALLPNCDIVYNL